MTPTNADMRTGDLMARLERHYIAPPPEKPLNARQQAKRLANGDGGIFIAETGINGEWGGSSRCDALHVGFTSASGRVLTGHEVKVSRADWLSELRKVGKADTWADQCHRWFLVVPTAEIVQPGELPVGWGLMIPGSRTRMKVLTEPTTYHDRVPGWDAVRSIMARQDTLQRQRLAGIDREILTKVAAMVPVRVAEEMAEKGLVKMTPEMRQNTELLARFAEATGVDLKTFTPRRPGELQATPEEFAAALRVVRAATNLGGPHGEADALLRQYETVGEHLQQLLKGLDDFRSGSRH